MPLVNPISAANKDLSNLNTPVANYNIKSLWFDNVQYFNSVGAGAPIITASSSGTGSGASIFGTGDQIDGWLGGLKLNTGTASNGYAYFSWNNSAFMNLSNSYRYNFGCNLYLSALGDATDNYDFFFGLSEVSAGKAGVVDGVFASYNYNEDAGNWRGNTRSNSSATTGDLGLAVAATTNFDVRCSIYNGSVQFYANGSAIGSPITTNIPLGTARNTQIFGIIIKTAGTTARIANIEWAGYGKRNS